MTTICRRCRAEHWIGIMDDLQDADGIVVLNDGHAQKAAREWWRAELRREEGMTFATTLSRPTVR
jgi:hypothetical protein